MNFQSLFATSFPYKAKWTAWQILPFASFFQSKQERHAWTKHTNDRVGFTPFSPPFVSSYKI